MSIENINFKRAEKIPRNMTETNKSQQQSTATASSNGVHDITATASSNGIHDITQA
jgi:hypothetical protein